MVEGRDVVVSARVMRAVPTGGMHRKRESKLPVSFKLQLEPFRRHLSRGILKR